MRAGVVDAAGCSVASVAAGAGPGGPATTAKSTQVTRRVLGEVVSTGIKPDRVVGGRSVEHGVAANVLDALLEIGAVRPVTGK